MRLLVVDSAPGMKNTGMNENTSQLIVVTARPFNAETPLAALRAPITPTQCFFVRSNFDVPSLDERTWRLSIDGAVDSPTALTLSQLQSLPATRIAVTLECAGNARRLMQPVPAGTAWELGAVSTAVFTGVALRDALASCGVHDDAVELVFTGADHGIIDGHDVQFARSLTRAQALHGDTLLVWAMNDEPLTAEHGYPLRLLVPGWYGVASVKWLTRITAVTEPFTGHFQTDRYVYRQDDTVADETPVTRMHVRAVIAAVERTPDGMIVHGIAWSGHAPVTRVELSFDGGATWQSATLAAAASSYAARTWSYTWRTPAGSDYEIIARAMDGTGETQPLRPRWNELGYGNNVAQRVRAGAVTTQDISNTVR
jgi:sulfite oxidase